MEVENCKMSGIPKSQQQIDRERKAAETQRKIKKTHDFMNKHGDLIAGGLKAAQYLPLAAGAAAGIGVGISKLVKHVRKKHQERKKKLRFK